MAKPVVLFIVEGESRDLRFANEMARCFMRGKYEVAIVSIPAAQNIYMLYNQLLQDDFETDVVEVLRETVPEARKRLEGVPRRAVSQVFLFFDFDPHQDNLPGERNGITEVLPRMLEAFDNETENGKLFISYPMVEALYDYQQSSCQAYSSCFVDIGSLAKYKQRSGKNNPNSNAHMGITQWADVLEVFALRTKCLLDLNNLDFELYRNSVTPKSIYEAECRLAAEENRLFVLSAFPEFLLDYFDRSFWNSRIKMKRFKFDYCEKAVV